MQPELRRIVAVEAHRRRTGRCPVCLHSLGTGESFAIEATADGFVDVASGLKVCVDGDRIAVPSLHATIDFALIDDVGFAGYDHSSEEPFTGRAGGGVSVTLYSRDQRDFFQYAVVAPGDHP
jgi:hypothetical protein